MGLSLQTENFKVAFLFFLLLFLSPPILGLYVVEEMYQVSGQISSMIGINRLQTVQDLLRLFMTQPDPIKTLQDSSRFV